LQKTPNQSRGQTHPSKKKGRKKAGQRGKEQGHRGKKKDANAKGGCTRMEQKKKNRGTPEASNGTPIPISGLGGENGKRKKIGGHISSQGWKVG